jgi:chromate transporter
VRAAGRIAIGDWLTALIGLASLAVLFRWKVSNPMLIAATAVVGLIAYPLLQPTRVMMRDTDDETMTSCQQAWLRC